MRLDTYLKEKGFTESRARAVMLIEGGNIKVDGKIVMDKKKEIDEKEAARSAASGQKYIEIIQDIKYVSRAGYKLSGAIDFLQKENINILEKINRKVCLDIGSSTGGFTQVLLECGAEKVFSVDVGTDQFNKKLLEKYNFTNGGSEAAAKELKINLFEKTDIRDFAKIEKYKNYFDFIVCDISFISIEKILESIKALLKENAFGILLIKPQFEVGRLNIGSGGLVKDEKYGYEKVLEIKNNFEENNIKVLSLFDSPILGGDGNKEYIFYIHNKNKN